MRCLCCNKEIVGKDSNYWHPRCVSRFFGTSSFPKIDLEDIENLGEVMVDGRKTITGVQPKLSFHLGEDGKQSKLTLLGYPYGFLLKPNTAEYPFIAEAEFVTMKLAEACDVFITPCALILVDGCYYYITKRIDRVGEKKIHMEDFCQLSSRLSEDKYNSSYERCMKIIDLYSSRAQADKVELYRRLVFCFITLNNDMHLKNFSLIEGANGTELSPQYDLLPVGIVNPKDKEEMALTLNGKKKGITRNDFLKLAKNAGIDEKVAQRNLDQILSKGALMEAIILDSVMPENAKKLFIEKMKERIDRLAKYEQY